MTRTGPAAVARVHVELELADDGEGEGETATTSTTVHFEDDGICDPAVVPAGQPTEESHEDRTG